MPEKVSKFSDFQTRWYGVNGSSHSSFIGEFEAVEAENISFRGQKPHPRPGVRKLAGDDIDEGVFQGFCYYSYDGRESFICSIGGRIYSIAPLGSSVDALDITPSTGGNDPYQKMVWMCQVDKYLVIQDGVRAPIVVLGNASKRADGDYPIPIGTAMAYVNGRLFVANGPYVRAGDLIGSTDDAVLQFSENIYLNEGGDFKAPATMGNVVAMSAMPNQDSATGQGPLLVWCENGVFSINSIIPRDQWKNTQIQAITLLDIGATGHRSIINVNGDSWFRSHDGWRTYRQARSEITGYNQVPLSQPVRQYVDGDHPRNLKYVSCVYWNNRLLMTSGPSLGNVGAFHLGVLSLDFDPISQGFGSDPQPAWEGIWTLGIYQVRQLLTGIFKGEKRCFAMAKGDLRENVLIEFIEDAIQDDNANDIVASLTTRQYSFPAVQIPWQEKTLAAGDIRIFDVKTTASIGVDWRQDDSCSWHVWHAFGAIVPDYACTPDPAQNCSIPCRPCYYAHRMKLPCPPDGIEEGNTVESRSNRQFIALQLRIRWNQGWFSLGDVRPECHTKDMSQNANPLS